MQSHPHRSITRCPVLSSYRRSWLEKRPTPYGNSNALANHRQAIIKHTFVTVKLFFNDSSIREKFLFDSTLREGIDGNGLADVWCTYSRSPLAAAGFWGVGGRSRLIASRHHPSSRSVIIIAIASHHHRHRLPSVIINRHRIALDRSAISPAYHHRHHRPLKNIFVDPATSCHQCISP